MHQRYKILAISSFILFTFYYVYDIPAALNKHLIQHTVAQKITFLYSIYAFPNMVLPLFIGFSSRIKISYLAASLCFLVFLGNVIFSLGVHYKNFNLMLIGRFIYGLGGESFAVIQNLIIAREFRGRELAFSMSLSSSIARCGTVFNYLITPYVADKFGCLLSCLIGVLLTFFGLSACVLMHYDKQTICLKEKIAKIRKKSNFLVAYNIFRNKNMNLDKIDNKFEDLQSISKKKIFESKEYKFFDEKNKQCSNDFTNYKFNKKVIDKETNSDNNIYFEDFYNTKNKKSTYFELFNNEKNGKNSFSEESNTKDEKNDYTDGDTNTKNDQLFHFDDSNNNKNEKNIFSDDLTNNNNQNYIFQRSQNDKTENFLNKEIKNNFNLINDITKNKKSLDSGTVINTNEFEYLPDTLTNNVWKEANEDLRYKKPFDPSQEEDVNFMVENDKRYQLDSTKKINSIDDETYLIPKTRFSPGFGLLVAISFTFAIIWAPFSSLATSMLQKRYNVSSLFAGRLMAIEEGFSLVLTVLIGNLSDYIGFKLFFVGIGGLLLIIAHILFFMIHKPPIIPIIILGFSGPFISCYWPCITYLVNFENIGAGFAIFTCFLNIAYTFAPMTVSILVTKDDTYDTVEFFMIFVGIIAFVFIFILELMNRKFKLMLNQKSFF
ncbi:hypothetical protein GVAV_002171 [Gurleya vavrai]